MPSPSNGHTNRAGARANAGGRPSPPKRTPAQAEASRKNGSKSRGPTTAEGKAKASQNATRHGLLARKIAPLHDARLEDREYEHLREQLIREFEPRTMSELNTVDVLAYDYIKLGRSAQMLDARFVEAGQADTGGREHVADAETRVDVVQRLLAQLRAGGRPECTFDQARDLLPLVMNQLEGADEPEATEDDAETAEPEPAEDGVLADALFPPGERRVMEILIGKLELKPAGSTKWLAIVERLLEHAKWKVTDAQESERRFLVDERMRQADLINSIATFERLQRYDAQIRRAIARAVEFLETRQRARS